MDPLCRKISRRIQPPLLSDGSEGLGQLTLNARPLVATVFSEADQRRFWATVEKGRENKCWEWQGERSRGYGRFWANAKRYSAHRTSYAIVNGAVPYGINVLHTC